ncbi:MAG: rod shape-determining protein MreD [Clostridiales bacterium]|nr:rod shape-determining protein MreD [Clostridiales bacterium]
MNYLCNCRTWCRFWLTKRSFNIEKVEVQSKLKQIILGIVLIITYVLQLTLVSEIQIFGVQANLLLIVTCAIAFLFGAIDGGLVGIIFGLLLDLYQGRAIGLSALIFMYLGVFIGGFNKKFFKDNYLILLILTVFATITYETALYIFSIFAYSQSFMLLYLLKNLFLVTVINILFGAAVYPILLKINIGLEVHRNIFR